MRRTYKSEGFEIVRINHAQNLCKIKPCVITPIILHCCNIRLNYFRVGPCRNEYKYMFIELSYRCMIIIITIINNYHYDS